METPRGPTEMARLFPFPGIDEFQSLSSIFDTIERDDFDVVVFDTAPTGHTLRLLELPTSADTVFGSLGGLFGPQIIQVVGQVFGEFGDAGDRIGVFQGLLKKAANRLRNSLECTFVCVLIPEFLPLFETERLVSWTSSRLKLT
jgi:arsenite-transporting ATPase